MILTQQTLGGRLRDARKNVGMTQEGAADKVGLPRTAIVQIENGNRPVSSFELSKLAQHYGRDVAEFLSEESLCEDPFIFFRRLAGNEEAPIDPEIVECIALLREAKRLEGYLGEKSIALPPVYKYRDPATYQEAISQGKEMAMRERERLNLGSALIADIAEIISQQSLRVAAVPLNVDISGLFLHHPDYGFSILVNQAHGRARRRFSCAHEYAHALADREKTMAATRKENASQLVEKRANAFASEFLMPALGVCEALARMQKGASSRERSLLYDPTSNTADEHESRNNSEEQRITMREIAILAHEFMVSYDVAVYRLSDTGAIRPKQEEELLAQRDEGRFLIESLKLYNGDEIGVDEPYLRRQLILLAMDAFRQDKITRGRFRDVCALAKYPSDEFLRVAESLIPAVERDAA